VFNKEKIMYEFLVEGMSCGHCVKSVTKSLQEVDATAAVTVDLATQRIKVESAVELPKLAAAIVDAGYPVLHSTIM
jgi:copper chaperone